MSLIQESAAIKVSSTLDRSVGKRNLIDGNSETCWTSAQGLPQFIHITFAKSVAPKTVSITFQGGFVGTECAVLFKSPLRGTEWQTLKRIYPDDVNGQQIFDLAIEGASEAQEIKFVFEKSSDFFGRITVYDIQLG